MRRLLYAAGWIAVLALSATAQPRPPAAPPAEPQPVNLLTSGPSVVAVSSTVANRQISPEHLVDGDLGTAWNSRTGDLRGAWFGARISVDARVTTIRMTVGFTRVDPKLGDLFTMNPRISKVRVWREGVLVTEQALDPELRTLQDIAINQRGGQYKIEVVEVVPGSKPSWREICVSELEVWGMLPRGASPRASKPAVRVGSFDLPPAPVEAATVADLPAMPASVDAAIALAFDGHVPVTPAVGPGGLVAVLVRDPSMPTSRVAYSALEMSRIGSRDDAIERLPLADDDLARGWADPPLPATAELLRTRGAAITARLRGFRPFTRIAPTGGAFHAGTTSLTTASVETADPFVLEHLAADGTKLHRETQAGFDHGTWSPDGYVQPCTYRAKAIDAFVDRPVKQLLIAIHFSHSGDCDLWPDRFLLWPLP